MLKLKELKEGRTVTEEVFENVKQVVNYLEENDFFSWINDAEPEKELPDFTGVTEIYEIANIFREFDYSWWTMKIEEQEEPTFEENCGDYDIKVYRFEDHSLYLLVSYHQNVRLNNKIIYLTEKDFELLFLTTYGYERMSIDERNDVVRYLEDCFHI